MPENRNRESGKRTGLFMNIIIPSYGRSDNLIGSDYFDSARYCIPQSQESEYLKHLDQSRLVVIPDTEDGNIAKKRNWILKNIPRPLVMIDDDVECIGYFEGREGMKNGEHRRKVLEKERVMAFFDMSFKVLSDVGGKMFGLSQNEDNRIYKEFLPLSLSKIALGPVQGHLNHPLMFDEAVGTKDDYDMGLQQLRKYKILLRWNKFHYICQHGGNTGGIVSYRTKEKEIDYCKAIMMKWGKSIIKYRIPPRSMVDLLNAKMVNIPINGV
jgi:hypothetical protein